MDKKIESIENDIRRYEQLYKEWCLNIDRKMKANTLNVNTLNFNVNLAMPIDFNVNTLMRFYIALYICINL